MDADTDLDEMADLATALLLAIDLHNRRVTRSQTRQPTTPSETEVDE